MIITRRHFLSHVGFGLLVATSATACATPIQAACQRVSGFGSYQLGPFQGIPDSSRQVFLTTDLGFDETTLFCKVTTNTEAFRFPSARLGDIDFGVHEFFMDMQAVTIDKLTIVETSEGPQVDISGVLRSETRVFSGERMRTFIEDHVAFGCQATQLSQDASIEISKTNFSMTAQFSPTKEHAAIFGSQATFAGRLTRGNIIIISST